MKRVAASILIFCAAMAMSPATANAIDNNDSGNAHVTIESPAYVSGDLWASSAGVFATVSRAHSCWYPQAWWDDAVVAYEDGAVVEYNTASSRYEIVESIVDRAIGEGRLPNSLFASIDMFASRSCIQGSFVGRDDCSTEEMIGVLATSTVRDAFRQVTIATGSFDHHDIGNLYCLVVIERDPWLEIVRDQALVPEPTRATFPQFRTLVGLENSVWYEVAAGDDLTNTGFSIAINTTGNPYNLTLDIWLTGIRVDIDGDGEWDFNKDCPGTTADVLAPCAGSPENPVYTFEYETRAFHPFTIQTLWAGQATGPTGEVLNINPGLLVNDHTFDWETVEVRSSLDS